MGVSSPGNGDHTSSDLSPILRSVLRVGEDEVDFWRRIATPVHNGILSLSHHLPDGHSPWPHAGLTLLKFLLDMLSIIWLAFEMCVGILLIFSNFVLLYWLIRIIIKVAWNGTKRLASPRS